VNDNQDAFSSLGILEWLQGRVAGLRMMMVGAGNYMPIIRGVEAAIYLDEVNVDVSTVQSLNVNNIAMIKVVTGSRMLGSSILIYTRTANMKSPNSKKSDINNKFELKSYNNDVNSFLISDYSQGKYNSVINDWRPILYWNPNFSSSKVTFFNNDNAKNCEITIIGFDKSGKITFYNEVLK
jgi:hypothetical protein